MSLQNSCKRHPSSLNFLPTIVVWCLSKDSWNWKEVDFMGVEHHPSEPSPYKRAIFNHNNKDPRYLSYNQSSNSIRIGWLGGHVNLFYIMHHSCKGQYYRIILYIVLSWTSENFNIVKLVFIVNVPNLVLWSRQLECAKNKLLL